MPTKRWPFTLDDTAPESLRAFLVRSDITWLPTAGARLELGLPTLLLVLATPGGNPRALACAPAEARAVVDGLGAEVETPPGDGLVWCVARVGGELGRWPLRLAVAPVSRPRLAVLRGGTGDGGEAPDR